LGRAPKRAPPAPVDKKLILPVEMTQMPMTELFWVSLYALLLQLFGYGKIGDDHWSIAQQGSVNKICETSFIG
jgi:hypothetical protein